MRLDACFRKNTQFLNPAFVKRLEDHNQTGVDPLVRLTKSNQVLEWNIGSQRGGFSFSDSSLNSIQSFHELCVVYGIGDGSFLEKLREIETIKHILVFEPSLSLVADLMREKDLSVLLGDSRIRFLFGPDTKDYLGFIEAYFFEEIDRICAAGAFINLVTPGYERIPLVQDYFNFFAQSFQAAAKNVLGKASYSSEDSFFGLMNYSSNLNLISKEIHLSRLKNLAEGRPAVVVATGPSLKHCLPALKKIQDHVTIVSCDSASPILQINGIQPDFVCSLERCVESVDILAQCQNQDFVYVVPTVVYPKTLESFKGVKVFVARDTGFDGWFKPDEPRYFLGQTVSQMTLQVAAVLGAKKIYMLGLDCAFDPYTNDSHHDDAHEMLKEGHDWVKEAMANDVVDVTGYDGKPKKTWPIWLLDTQAITRIAFEGNLDLIRVSPVEYGFPIDRVNRVDPEELFSVQKTSALGKNFTHKVVKLSNAELKNRKNHDEMKIVLQQSLSYLDSLRSHCCEILAQTTDFYYNHRPHFIESKPKYEKLFEDLKIKKENLIRDPNRFFERTLFSLLQGRYVHYGFNIKKTHVEDISLEAKIDKNLKLYREWYSEVIAWSSRVLSLLNKSDLL